MGVEIPRQRRTEEKAVMNGGGDTEAEEDRGKGSDEWGRRYRGRGGQRERQ